MLRGFAVIDKRQKRCKTAAVTATEVVARTRFYLEDRHSDARGLASRSAVARYALEA